MLRRTRNGKGHKGNDLVLKIRIDHLFWLPNHKRRHGGVPSRYCREMKLSRQVERFPSREVRSTKVISTLSGLKTTHSFVPYGLSVTDAVEPH